MKKFDRGIRNQKFIDALNTLYANKNSFWYKMVNDKELFIAIRKEYLNVYFMGQSVCRLEYKNAVIGRTHKKYLGVQKAGYFDSENGVISSPESKIKSLSEFRIIKETIQEDKHIGKEKGESYTEILDSKKCIIDVEVALVNAKAPSIQRKSKYKVSSIDYVSLENNEQNELRLVFYEAKHFTNPEIRSTKKPKVFGQILRYKKALKLHEKEIQDSYSVVIENLRDLNILAQRNSLFNSLTSMIFPIDFEPILIVFGVGNVKKPNIHLDKLEDHFGSKLNLK